MSAALSTIRNQGVVAIIRTPDAEQALKSLQVLSASGLRAIEVSLVTPNAIEIIREGVSLAPAGVHIGVGTALTVDDVTRAAGAGARFVVSPGLNERVLKASLEAGLDCLPGVATPSEALQAREWGATLIKLFPGSLWSPAALRDVLTALPELEFVPTGGVSAETAPDWIRAGAAALGIGSFLTRAADPAATVQKLLGAISQARA